MTRNVTKVLRDGIMNVASALGKSNAKVAATHYVANSAALTEADDAYDNSTWYAKILRIPVEDGVREWRKWSLDGTKSDLVHEEEQRLQLPTKLLEAQVMARHQGGALLIIGGLPGAPSSPLDLSRIGQGDIEYIHALSRHDVNPGELTTNPYSEHFRMPEYWTVNDGTPNGTRVHASRVVFFPGDHAPGSIKKRSTPWGNPLWQRLSDAVMASDSGAAILTSLLHEAKQDIITMPNLAEILASDDGETIVQNKVTSMAMLKSIANTLILDGGAGEEESGAEKWEQKQFHWQGLPDVIKVLLTVMAGAGDIPLTRLLGEQQTGLSGNDSGSLRHYYDAVGAGQKLRMGPTLLPFDRMLLRSALGETDDKVKYKWNPIWQPSPKEAAEAEKMEAETVQIYAVSGMVPKAALMETSVARMADSGRFPALQEGIDKLGENWADKAVEELRAMERAKETPDDNPDDPNDARNQGAAVNDAEPRPLYVARKVMNAQAIIDHYKEQGFEVTQPAEELHVTVVYSKEPVDWFKVGASFDSDLRVPRGGPRMNEKFGDAQVLLFTHNELVWRHLDAKYAGASWDHEEYQPHITISYDPRNPDIRNVEPYQGTIVLGAEIFRDIEIDWSKGIEEV